MQLRGAKSKLLRIPLVKALNDFRINLRDKRELQSRQHLIPQIAKCINDDTTVISNNCCKFNPWNCNCNQPCCFKL